MKEINAE